MDFVVSWWNCHLRPPSRTAKKRDPQEGFDHVVKHLLIDRRADLLGLCEVDAEIIQHLKQLLIELNLVNYRVIDLYQINGKSIDDLCVIYNSSKLAYVGELAHPNCRDALSERWLKAGKLLEFRLETSPLFICVSHWQGRGNFSPRSELRNKLGDAIRQKIDQIRSADASAFIIACGDYNDEPFEASIEQYLGASRDASYVKKKPHYLFNPFWSCLAHGAKTSSVPPGTYLGEGENVPSGARTFDQIIFCSNFLRHWDFIGAGAEIVDDSLPAAHQWQDISDHIPILTELRRIQ